MTTFEIIFAATMMIIWGCFGITMLISSIQSIVYDKRREKSELERDARDREYHEERMKDIN